MALLVRKINRSKWPNVAKATVFDVRSDAITNCLKSSSDALSVWKIQDEDSLDEAVLALAAGCQHLETIDVVILESDKLQGIQCTQTTGITPVVGLTNTHHDLSDLNYHTIGIIAELIVEKTNKKNVKRYTERMLKEILNKAIGSGRLKREDLKEGILKKLGDLPE